MSYAIETVPLPQETYRRRGRPRKYPFDQLGVGDSFVLAATDSPLSARRAAAHFSKTRGVDVRVRKDGDRYRAFRLS